jgi:hypothetical protein
MPLHNILILPTDSDTAPRVPFNTLRVGERFQHTINGWVSLVYFKSPDFLTIKRPDGWLVKVLKEDVEVWGKMVIKL